MSVQCSISVMVQLTNLPWVKKSERHFFATSHGKNACDGVGGNIKGLAAYANLQRPISNQILTPLQLFEFANAEIHGVGSFFISKDHVDQVVQFLQPRFSNSPKFKGTCKNHQFIPAGTNTQMSRVLGDSGRADLINAPGVNIVNIEEIVTGSFHAYFYDKEWYFGIVNSISHENADVNFKFMHPNGLSVHFFGQLKVALVGSLYMTCWILLDDTCWIPVQNWTPFNKLYWSLLLFQIWWYCPCRTTL